MTLVISKGLTLDNGTRAAAIAGVSPTLDYRFARENREIETVSLTDKLTYTGGNGTFVGSDGFIQRATTNVPRFDHDPLSRRSLGLLSEGSRENLLLRSEEFDNGSWFLVGGSVGRNLERSPDGTFTADRLTAAPSPGTTGQIVQAATIASSATVTTSIFVKAAGFNRIGTTLLASNNTTPYGAATFNVQTGQIDVAASSSNGGSNASASIEPYPSDWYRCRLTVTYPATTSAGLRLLASNSDGAVGDGVKGVFLWGAQLEAASSASAYIPTTSAAVTRTADSAVIDGTGILTGTYTMVEKPAGCAVVSGTNINLQPGFTAERVMVFPAALDAGQITAIRGAM